MLLLVSRCRDSQLPSYLQLRVVAPLLLSSCAGIRHSLMVEEFNYRRGSA